MYRSMIQSLLLIFALTLLLAENSFAERRADAFTLTPMAGGHVIDGGMDLKNSEFFGLGIGYNISPQWSIEADVRYTPTETDTSDSSDRDIWAFSLGGLYHFIPAADVTPYLSFGAGFLSYDLEGKHDDEDPFGYYGGGFKFALGESVDLRLDARHILDYRSDNRFRTNDDDPDWRHHLQTMVGLTFQFGSTAADRSEQKTMPVTSTEDADPDADNDGVLVAYDKCPGTSPGVRVDSDGCPADTDGDGVKDYMDACVDTPEGTDVDSQGCPEKPRGPIFFTRNLLFGFDKDQVTPFHYSELKQVEEIIDQYPTCQIVVEGHADDRGTAEYNQALSLRRAKNIQDVLIDRYGVAADHIKSVGFGFTRPIAVNSIAEERMKNRRVEISVYP